MPRPSFAKASEGFAGSAGGGAKRKPIGERSMDPPRASRPYCSGGGVHEVVVLIVVMDIIRLSAYRMIVAQVKNTNKHG